MAAHRPTKAIGLGAAEPGAFHRNLEDLLLVEDDTARFLEDRFQARMDVHHRLLALLAPQVRMHRIALDRSGADAGDRDADDAENRGSGWRDRTIAATALRGSLSSSRPPARSSQGFPGARPRPISRGDRSSPP